MKLEDLKKEVVETIVNSSVMTGFENHGDIHNPELVDSIMGNFDMVETGIIQGMPVDELLTSTVEKIINGRRGGDLIDIWKEICKGGNDAVIEKLGRGILKDVRAIEPEGFLAIPKTVTGGKLIFATANGAVDGAHRRYNKFVEAISAGKESRANRAKKELLLILRDYPMQQKDIIERIFGLNETIRLQGISNKLRRFIEVQIKLNEVRADKIRADQKGSKVKEAKSVDHLTLPVVQTLKDARDRFKMIIEDDSLDEYVKAANIFKVITESPIKGLIWIHMYPGTLGYVQTLDSSKVIMGLTVWIKDRIRRNDLDVLLSVNEEDVKVGAKQPNVQPWVIFPNVAQVDYSSDVILQSEVANSVYFNELVDKLDLVPWTSEKYSKAFQQFIYLIQIAHNQERFVKHMFSTFNGFDSFSPEGRGKLIMDHLLPSWLGQQARSRQPSSLNTQHPLPTQKEIKVNPQEDFAKSVFLDVLKANNAAFANYDSATGERKAVMEELFEAMYNNFVKPTLSRVGTPPPQAIDTQSEYVPCKYTGRLIRNPNKPRTQRVELRNGQYVEITGLQSDLLTQQLTSLFQGQPQMQTQPLQHPQSSPTVLRASFVYEGRYEFNLEYDSGNKECQIYYMAFNAPVARQQRRFDILRNKVESLDIALQIFEECKSHLQYPGITGAQLSQVATLAMQKFTTLAGFGL